MELSPEQKELLHRRRQQLEGMEEEMDLMLVKMAEDFGLAKPKNILLRPENYLKGLHEAFRDKLIGKGEFSWVALQTGYFLTALFRQRHGGQLFLADQPTDPFFGEILLGNFRDLPPSRVLNPFKMALAFCWTDPPRDFQAAVEAAERVLVGE